MRMARQLSQPAQHRRGRQRMEHQVGDEGVSEEAFFQYPHLRLLIAAKAHLLPLDDLPLELAAAHCQTQLRAKCSGGKPSPRMHEHHAVLQLGEHRAPLPPPHHPLLVV